jgi:succinate dehydrogenase / fumarate reductase flavoprotein subunit
VVFGRAAGNHILEFLKSNHYHKVLPEDSTAHILERMEHWNQSRENSQESYTVPQLKAELQKTMEENCGVFRTENVLEKCVSEVKAIKEKLSKAYISDYSNIFNTARIEALELENLIEIGLATVISALARKESRGAHSRMDFEKRDDINWMKHSLYFLNDNRLTYKSVRTKALTVETFPPRERIY